MRSLLSITHKYTRNHFHTRARPIKCHLVAQKKSGGNAIVDMSGKRHLTTDQKEMGALNVQKKNGSKLEEIY